MADLSNRARGAYGERRAAQWYVAHGFEVLDRNWRNGRSGELDLVVADSSTLVFCEVKARRTADFGLPAEAITPAKLARLHRLGYAWVEQHPEHRRRSLRFDIAAVLGTEVEVFEAEASW
jgi:putative endonuclease